MKRLKSPTMNTIIKVQNVTYFERQS